MPTVPVILPDGTRVRLTTPQWQLLRAIVTRLERRQMQETWLPRELFPEPPTRASPKQRLIPLLADKGVLLQNPTGYQLAAGIAAQVRAWEEARRDDA
jgi:hypothetical protein